jgi:hypothetical protein
MSSGVMTLSDFERAEKPPSVRAPWRDPFTSFIKVVLGPLIASGATTTVGVGRQQSPTVEAQPQLIAPGELTAFARRPSQRIDGFIEALNEALALNFAMVDAEDGDPLDNQTLQYAIQSLLPLIASLELPTPLILPLQAGGIGAEWHICGMNVELRFRKPYDVYALVEDARGGTSFRGRDPDLTQTGNALLELSTRSCE